VVWVRSGRAVKPVRAAAGSWVSRPEVAGTMLGLGLGAAQQPAESFLAQDVADGGAAQRGSFPGQPGDLVDRQAVAAQLDGATAGGFLFPRAFAPGDASRGEQGELSCPQVAYQGRQRGAGVASGVGGLPMGCAVMQVGAQGLVAALVYLAGADEQVPPRAWGRYGGHVATSAPHTAGPISGPCAAPPP
jgi:hypothetical protein